MKIKKGILVVSFGTSHEDTREKTIGAIEAAVCVAHPQIPVYFAWTSGVIRAKILKKTGEKICGTKEALAQMKADGITHVYIQATHIINGIEYELLKEDTCRCKDFFSAISFGKPLLSSTEDMKELTRIIAGEFSDILASGGAALVLMGHGTEHHSNTGYAALDYMFRETGHPDIHVGTVEAYPSPAQIIPLLDPSRIKTVHLAPLMTVAGDHAKNDMAGNAEDSWASQFARAGYHVVCHLKGRGEYPAVRRLFLRHLDEILD